MNRSRARRDAGAEAIRLDRRQKVMAEIASRDAETAKTIAEVWRQVRHIGNLVFNWREPETESALVVADALIDQGFTNVGNDLSRFAKRMQKWKAQVPYWSAQREVLKQDPSPPKWEQWKDITERVDTALKQIAKRTPTTREWHHKRPHQAMIVFEPYDPRAARPRLRRIDGPFPITPRDAEDMDTIRKWFKKLGYPALGKVHQFWIDGAYQPFTRVGNAIILYPDRGPWRKITIELGQVRNRSRGREVLELARLLEQAGFTRPQQYARMLQRHGSTPEHLVSMLRNEGADAVARRYGFHRAVRERE